MASLVASTVPTLGIVKLLLNWAPYVNESVAIYRVEPDGTEVPVIGSPIRLSGSDALIYDTTAPLDVNLTYKAVLANPTVLRDGFNRTVSSTWGAPDYAAAAGNWNNIAPNADYLTSNGKGIHRLNSIAVHETSTQGTYTDVRISGTMSIPVAPLGAPIETTLMTRYTGAANHYQFVISWPTSGNVTMTILKRVAGVQTVIASSKTGTAMVPGRQVRVVAESVGRRHRMTLWANLGPQFAIVLDVLDSTFPSTGAVGARSLVTAGNTNTLPVDISFDNLLVEDLSTYTVTSNTVNVITAPHGWMRDPLEPARSIRLDNCASHTFDCLVSNQMVFFQGLGDEGYKSATGVFAVNNSARPTTIGQPRKDLETELRFASVTLNDITRVRNLFATGRNLSLYLPTMYGWGIDSYGAAMFTASDLQASRLNRTDMRKPYRLWSTDIAVADLDDDLPHNMVGGNAIPIPGATVGDLKATGMTAGQLTSGTVLNPNPFFETNTAGWSSSGGTIVRSTAQFHEGVASLLLTPDGVSVSAEATTSTYFPLTGGQACRISAWVRCAVARSIRLFVVWHNGTVETGNVSLSTSVSANTWTFMNTATAVPAGTVQARLAVALDSTPAVGHTTHIDEAKIARVPTVLQVAQGVFV